MADRPGAPAGRWRLRSVVVSVPGVTTAPRVDERDQAVSRKSAWLAYRIVANGCWIVSLAALVVYGISRIPAALAVTITLDAVTIGAFAALLGAEVYYEKRM